jgi:hypothetical protein
MRTLRQTLGDQIADQLDLSPRSYAIVTAAWEQDHTKLETAMAKVEGAQNPVAYLIGVCKRINVADESSPTPSITNYPTGLIQNRRGSIQDCAACENTGLVTLVARDQELGSGRKIVEPISQQPEAAACRWCERGYQKHINYPRLSYTYEPDAFELPPSDAVYTPEQSAAARAEAVQAWRAMQQAFAGRSRELREGTRTPEVPVGPKADGSTAPAVPERHPATTASTSDKATEAIGAAP